MTTDPYRPTGENPGGFSSAWSAPPGVWGRALEAAAERAHEVGIEGTGPLTGSFLRLLTAATSARAVVEVGTGTGSSGLWLLQGMAVDGVLTSIDVEGEHTRLARSSFADGGVAASRVRLITGQALDVLPRLADAAYDLIHVDGRTTEHPEAAVQALRLLRPGGIMVFNRVLADGRVADPAARDGEAVALRALLRSVREDEDLVPLLLPVEAGLLAAVKRP